MKKPWLGRLMTGILLCGCNDEFSNGGNKDAQNQGTDDSGRDVPDGRSVTQDPQGIKETGGVGTGGFTSKGSGGIRNLGTGGVLSTGGNVRIIDSGVATETDGQTDRPDSGDAMIASCGVIGSKRCDDMLSQNLLVCTVHGWILEKQCYGGPGFCAEGKCR